MYIIGAVVDTKQSKVALYNKEYKLLTKKIGACEELSKLCLDVLAESGASVSDVEYVGVSVDSARTNPDSVAAELEQKIGAKCIASSLIGAKALGEAYATNDVPSLFLLKIDDTVETGVVIDKKLYSGVHTRGGSVAHMVINFGGFECACGGSGCFEAYVGNAGLKRIAAEAGVEGAESITHKELFDMDTPAAARAKDLYVKYLANGITNLINLFQLNEFVLEGAFTEAGEKIMKPIMDIVLVEQFSHNMSNKCNVRFANQEIDTALLGAALLGR